MTTVLISTYNGEKYLREQIDSLINQTVAINILVRDDGSKDGTVEILEEYKKKGILDYYLGNNFGATKSFISLLKNAPFSDFYAFCDQDDIWDNNKIEVALKNLNNYDSSIPLLYCSATRPVDENLNELTVYNKPKYKLTFGESLIQPFASGCTFVFNYEVKKLFDNKDIDFMSNHDWYMHKVVAAFGTIIYDETPHISYRQHGQNVIGYKKDSVVERIKRFLLGKNKKSRYLDAVSLHKIFFDDMIESNKKILNIVVDYNKCCINKLKLIYNKQIKTTSFKENFILAFVILFGRL